MQTVSNSNAFDKLASYCKRAAIRAIRAAARTFKASGVAADVQATPPGAVVEVLDYDIEGFEDDLRAFFDDAGIDAARDAMESVGASC